MVERVRRAAIMADTMEPFAPVVAELADTWARWISMSSIALLNRLRSGSGTLGVAAVWAVFDALAHVAVDEVEPLRIAGNAAVLVALGLSWATLRWRGAP